MGYRNVYEYNEGYPEWVKRGYPFVTTAEYPTPEVPLVTAAELKAMIDRNEKIIMVDVRDDDDRQTGWIKDSVHIPMIDLEQRSREVPSDRPIILVDLYGKQTYIAARYLASRGVHNLRRLDSGLVNGWIKAGYPVTKE